MVLSVSSAFATSDDITLNEVNDEIIVNEDTLAIEDEVNLIEEVSDETILETADESEDVLESGNVVTPENWQDFIDNESKMITYDGDELIFEGNFGSDLNITAINVFSPIKLTGNDAVMTNISFYILSDDVVMSGFTLIEDKNDVSPIFAVDVENVEISNVKLNFTAIDDHHGYAIWMSGVDNIKLLNNIITYTGTTVYNELDTNRKIGILIEESNKALIKGNKFKFSISSCHVDWPEVPAGSYNWVRTPYTEGVLIDDCDDLEFSGNTVVCDYTSRSGSDDSIYVVDVINSAKAIISGNNIKTLGADHIYGIVVENVNDFTISGNDVNVSSDVYQAIGIDVEGPATGVIKGNNVTASGTLVNAIYSGMNWKSATVTIENNNITAEGYEAIALELGGTSATVEGNTIVAKGNYTAGIISTIPELTISANNIDVDGSNLGDSLGDYYMSKEVLGVKIISGVANINNNNITSNNIGVSGSYGTTVTLSNNNVDVVSNVNISSIAIRIDSATLNMFNNNITYVGSTVYDAENTTVINAVLVSKSRATVKNNAFDLTISSCHVDWPEVPAGSYNWVRTPYSEGIVFDECDDLEFSGNTVVCGYNSRSGSEDTIYVLDVLNSDNAVISGNTIKALGADHVYGIIVDGADNFTISGNDVNVSSDVYQAIGIDVEGPATGAIKGNNVTASGTLVNAIYSGMNWKSATVTIENNNITAEGYAANALELGGTSATVEGNTIVAKGNYTAGIISTIPNASIKNNVITAEGSNIGDASIGDYYMKKEVVAIISSYSTVNLEDNSITSSNIGIKADGSSVTLSKNNISVISVSENSSSYAVILDSSVLNMVGNNVTYVGLNNGSVISNSIFVSKSAAIVNNNRFDLTISSCHVDWPEVPAGSYNWVRTPYSEGIVFDECNDLEFAKNIVNLNYNSRVGSSDSIYVVDVKNSDNAVISGNTIKALGADHVYGIIVDGADNFTISGNDVNVSSDVYQAIGIDVEGPATGAIKGNNVTASGTLVNAIYSGMNWKSATVTIENNNITAEGYAANALELGGTSATVEGNTIVAKGNYTAGIISTIPNASIKNNVITAEGSNIGDASTGDYYMKKEVVAINVADGVATISENTIESTGDNAIDLGNTNSVVADNRVIANNTSGDAAISSTGNASIKGNGIIKTRLIGVDASGIYGNVVYSVNLTYENGTPIVGKTITFTVDKMTFTAVTDTNGVATVNIDKVGKGTYTIEASYAGNGSDVGATTTNVLSISPKAVNLVYQKSLTLLITAVKKGSYFKIVVKDVDGKVVEGSSVKIVFNKQTSILSTNKNGVVSYKLSATKSGNYVLTVSVDDGKYTGSGSATIKINKEATKLTAKKATFKAKKKSKKYSVILKDSKGKAISKVTVKIKVGKKTYTAKTNKKGKATFNLKKLTKKGKYTAKITFKTTALYKAATKSVKITVKK